MKAPEEEPQDDPGDGDDEGEEEGGGGGEEDQGRPVPDTRRPQTFVRTARTCSSYLRAPASYPPDPRVGRGPFLLGKPLPVSKPSWVLPDVPMPQDVVLRSDRLQRAADVDPRYVTALYDFSMDRFDLGNRRYRGTFQTHARYMAQEFPLLPNYSTPTRQSPQDARGALALDQLGTLRYEPRVVSELEINSLNGWVQLPQPSPAWCVIQGLGSCMVLFWRHDLLVPEVLRYAVVKLYPMGLDPDDAFAGLTLDVFAEWVCPLKWAVSLVGNSQGNFVLVADDGTEFQMAPRTFKWSRDARVCVARNVLMRDYPGFMRGFMAMKPVPVDPEVVLEAENNAQAFERARGLPLSAPPPPQQQQQDQESEGEEAEEEAAPPPPPRTAPAGCDIVIQRKRV